MYDRMIKEHGYSIRRLAQKLGKDKGYLENRLRLADAPPEIQDLVSVRKDTVSHAYELLKIEDPRKRRRLAEQVARGELTLVRLRERVEGRRRPRRVVEVEPPEELVEAADEDAPPTGSTRRPATEDLATDAETAWTGVTRSSRRDPQRRLVRQRQAAAGGRGGRAGRRPAGARRRSARSPRSTRRTSRSTSRSPSSASRTRSRSSEAAKPSSRPRPGVRLRTGPLEQAPAREPDGPARRQQGEADRRGFPAALRRSAAGDPTRIRPPTIEPSPTRLTAQAIAAAPIAASDPTTPTPTPARRMAATCRARALPAGQPALPRPPPDRARRRRAR